MGYKSKFKAAEIDQILTDGLEKLDSIDFGYYTFATENVVANWGPFTIKAGEIKTIDTLVTWKPIFIKIDNKYHEIMWEDDEGFPIGADDFIFKMSSTKLVVDTTNVTRDCTLQFYNYQRMTLNDNTCIIAPSIIKNVDMCNYFDIFTNSKMPEINRYNAISKYTCLSVGLEYIEGILVSYETEVVMEGEKYIFKLLNFKDTPCIITVTAFVNFENIITSSDITSQELSLK